MRRQPTRAVSYEALVAQRAHLQPGSPPTTMSQGIEKEIGRIQEVVADAVRDGDSQPTLLKARCGTRA